jgi:hypothetical protein
MKRIPDGSVDMVMADLPYGTTYGKWDEAIPMEKLWPEYKRVSRLAVNVVVMNLQWLAVLYVQPHKTIIVVRRHAGS